MIIKRKPRGTGKTKELVKISAQNNIPILCAHRDMARYAKCIARDLGLKIPEPLTVADFRGERYFGNHIGKILIDDLEMVLYEMFKAQVEVATTSAVVEFHGEESIPYVGVDISIQGDTAVKEPVNWDYVSERIKRKTEIECGIARNDLK